MNPRRLTRSRDRQLAGVAGGMAEYLDIDPTVVRILWIIVGIASGGLAIVAYIILALVMPQAPYATAPGGWAPAPGGWAPAPAAAPAPAPGPAGGWGSPQAAPAWGTGPDAAAFAAPAAPAWGAAPAAPAPGQSWDAGAYAASQARQRAEGRGLGAAAIVGVVLIVFGAIALADAALPGWAAAAILGPAVILALGAALLVSSLRRRPDEAPQAPAPAPAPAAAAAPSPAPAPVPAGTAFPAGPWDADDTQAVFAPATAVTSDETAQEGSSPA